MATLWRLGSGTVEQVRSGLPSGYDGAYTTVQTVLNRLVERNLLGRRQEGRSILYRPNVSEAEYLASTIQQTLSGASAGARQAALAELFGQLADDDRAEVQRLATRAAAVRKKR